MENKGTPGQTNQGKTIKEEKPVVKNLSGPKKPEPEETNLDEPMASGTPYLQKDPRELIWQRRDLIPKV